MFPKLTIQEAYELIKVLADGIAKSNRVGWTVFREGYRPEDGLRHWAVADDLSALRWEALSTWYRASSPVLDMVN